MPKTVSALKRAKVVVNFTSIAVSLLFSCCKGFGRQPPARRPVQSRADALRQKSDRSFPGTAKLWKGSQADTKCAGRARGPWRARPNLKIGRASCRERE